MSPIPRGLVRGALAVAGVIVLTTAGCSRERTASTPTPALPIAIRGGTGGPARIVAFLP